MTGEEGTHTQTCHHTGANHSDGLAKNIKSSNWSYGFGVLILPYFVLFNRVLKKTHTPRQDMSFEKNYDNKEIKNEVENIL